MMGAYRQVRFQANPLTWLLLCLTGIMSIILVHSEIGGLCLAVFCIAIHLLTGHSDKAIPYSVCYLVFTGIAWGGVRLVERPANKSQVEISAFGSSEKGKTKSSR